MSTLSTYITHILTLLHQSPQSGSSVINSEVVASEQMRFLVKLSSPGPKPLSPKPKNPKPRGLGLTLKSCRPPPTTTHPITFKHEGGVPQQNPKSKTYSEWSPLLVRIKMKVDSNRKVMEQSTMFSEKIINLTCCSIIKMPASRVDRFSAGRTKYRSPMLKEHGGTVQHCSKQSIFKEYLNQSLGLTLSTPGLINNQFCEI